MTLPLQVQQREYTKFRDGQNGPIVGVALESAVTIYAQVNTSSSGNVTVVQGTSPWIVSTSSLPTVSVGSMPTVYAVTSANSGNVTLNPSPNFIGLATVVNASPVTVHQGSTPWNSLGTITLGSMLPTGTNFIGLVTVKQGGAGSSTDPWPVRLYFGSGQAANDSGGNMVVNVSNFAIGSFGENDDMAANLTSALAFSENFVFDGTNWDRMRTANIANATTGIGLAGAGILGFDGTNYRRVQTNTAGVLNANVSLSSSSAFIGLVSTASINGRVGIVREKTLQMLPFSHGASGFATLISNQGNWFITSLAVNANSSVCVSILSGATVLLGNASVGMYLSPGGGWVETGTIDAPVYRSLASGAGLVIRSNAADAIIGGKIVYYTE